jgi:hypothetical protein
VIAIFSATQYRDQECGHSCWIKTGDCFQCVCGKRVCDACPASRCNYEEVGRVISVGKTICFCRYELGRGLALEGRDRMRHPFCTGRLTLSESRCLEIN